MGVHARDWSQWTISVQDSDGEEILAISLANFREIPPQ